jgi:hypothetical protein
MHGAFSVFAGCEMQGIELNRGLLVNDKRRT